MDNIESLSFCFGLFYGGLAAGFLAVIAGQIRQARMQMGLKNRSLDNFPDAAQPGMTSSGIVRTSQLAAFRFIFFSAILLILVVLALVGAYFIVQ